MILRREHVWLVRNLICVAIPSAIAIRKAERVAPSVTSVLVPTNHGHNARAITIYATALTVFQFMMILVWPRIKPIAEIVPQMPIVPVIRRIATRCGIGAVRV